MGDGCWEWTGAKDWDGYGRMRIGGRRSARAHRIAWAIANRSDPGSLFVCHRCDNPSCVRPGHLYLGTALQNNRDKIERGRTNWARGSRVGTSKLTDEQVEAVFALYKSGNVRQKDIARQFGVSQSAVQLVLSGKNWGRTPVPNMRHAPKRTLRKLSDDLRTRLIADYRAGGVSQSVLAKRYGVSQQYVSLAIIE